MSNNPEITGLRKCIEDFLVEKREEKLKKDKGSDLEKNQIANRFKRENWLADAAKRVSQLQLVTHAIKFSHPDARGSNLYSIEAEIPEGYIGTELSLNFQADVVGNAAALDIFKFLKLEYDGKSLLQRVLDNDENLLAAFSDDLEQAKIWVKKFRALWREDAHIASHTLAKQVYFPINTHEYHLLAPLFPSSLVHKIYLIFKDERFSEDVKLARKARKDGKIHDHGYCEYPDLLLQKFGGAKPQNISQLNSERKGENWLLPSLPPVWNKGTLRLPLRVKSVFDYFLHNVPEVYRSQKRLKDFLLKTFGNYTNIRIRQTRAQFLRDMLDAIMQWAARIQNESPGWTMDDVCQLKEEEQFWLDPFRGELDPEWEKKRKEKEWQPLLINNAANWLNRQLTTDKLRMGDEEQREWKKEIAEAMREFETGETIWKS